MRGIKRKTTACLLAAGILAVLPFCTALAATVENNPEGTTISVLDAGDTMDTNSGTITTNNGTIMTNSGTIATNGRNGIVSQNWSIIESNEGTVENTHGSTSMISSNTGIVGQNFGGKINNNGGTVEYNYEGNVTGTGTVEYNCGGTVTGNKVNYDYPHRIDIFKNSGNDATHLDVSGNPADGMMSSDTDTFYLKDSASLTIAPCFGEQIQSSPTFASGSETNGTLTENEDGS